MHEDLTKLGLTIIYDFITEDEEKNIVEQFVKSPPKKTKSRNSIRRYGSSMPYNTDMASKIVPIFLDNISDKIVEKGLLEIKPNSVTVNEYFKGQGITPHIDSKSSGPVITILSVLSSATMLFEYGNQEYEVTLPPRCLIQMKDELRNKWQHSIKPVLDKRYSIVFRHGEK